LLSANPDLRPTEAAQRIGVARATIEYHRQRLERAGLIKPKSSKDQ
jgi:DNA-binding MarR family transcriptional regulator